MRQHAESNKLLAWSRSSQAYSARQGGIRFDNQNILVVQWSLRAMHLRADVSSVLECQSVCKGRQAQVFYLIPGQAVEHLNFDSIVR